ncbi:MAG: GntR family transcriptional regulator [Deltaproteobacteria bacterium]|nr:GntR family transcriptional regulator [Deltaproteobacteria bacterium]
MENMLSIPVEKLTLREKVVAFLRGEIIHQRLQPGEKLTEHGLSRKLKISRTPIREAFYQLEAEGFLTIEPRKGVRVADLRVSDIRNYYEIRKIMEGFAAREAARSVSFEQIKRLKSYNRRLLRLLVSGRASGLGIVKAHNNFHEYIVRLGSNEKMHEIYADLGTRCLRFRFMTTAFIEIDDIRRDHEEIIRALEQGDGSAAEAAVRKNADRGLETLLASLPARFFSQSGFAA